MIGKIVSSIALSLVFQVVFSTVTKKKTEKMLFFISLISYASFLAISYKYMNVLRFLLSLMFISLLNSFCYKEKLFKSTLISFVTFVLIALSEIVVMLVLVISGIDNIETNYYGMFIVNIAVSSISILIIRMPFIIKYIQKEFDNITNNVGVKIYLVFLVVFSNFALLVHYLYFDGSKVIQIILYVISIMLIALLFSSAIRIKSEKEIISNKYSEIVQNVTEYEEHLEKLRIINHENKNNLVIIRDMTDDNAIKQKISSILGHKSHLMEDKLLNLPKGGIRGIVAQKRDVCIKLNVKFSLYVQNKIKIAKKDELSHLLGIYLDNAIEAVTNLVEPEVRIGFYKDEITISNKYDGIIELDRMDDKGYSTKGPGRGYGLYLASEILKKSNIEVTKEISDVYKIKIKRF